MSFLLKWNGCIRSYRVLTWHILCGWSKPVSLKLSVITMAQRVWNVLKQSQVHVDACNACDIQFLLMYRFYFCIQDLTNLFWYPGAKLSNSWTQMNHFRPTLLSLETLLKWCMHTMQDCILHIYPLCLLSSIVLRLRCMLRVLNEPCMHGWGCILYLGMLLWSVAAC